MSPLFYFLSVGLAIISGYLMCWVRLKEARYKLSKDKMTNTGLEIVSYAAGNHHAIVDELLTSENLNKTPDELTIFVQENLWEAVSEYHSALIECKLKPHNIMRIVCWAYVLFGKENLSTFNINLKFK